MKQFLSLSLFIGTMGLMSLFAEHQKVLPDVQVEIQRIIEAEKIYKSICFTDEETRYAIRKDFDKDGISLESFSKIAQTGKKIVEGLRMIVNENAKPNEVYKNLNLVSHNVTPENWAYYYKTYTNEEKILNLEKFIPDTMEKIIDSGKDDFKRKLGNWLLYHRIIFECDSESSELKDLQESEKEKKWWSKEVRKYKLNPDKEVLIVNLISVSNTFDSATDILFRDIFKEKLQFKGDSSQ